MAGNKEGGKKTAETNIRKYGEDFYRRIGSKGGKAGGTGGFYHAKYVKGDIERVREAGRKGGAISRRTKKVEV